MAGQAHGNILEVKLSPSSCDQDSDVMIQSDQAISKTYKTPPNFTVGSESSAKSPLPRTNLFHNLAKNFNKVLLK